MNGILDRLLHGLREESGQAAVIGVVCLTAVLPCVALAIDVGQFRYEQQQMQGAVDAAALAGAIEAGSCAGTADCPAMQTAAQQALVENGFSGSTLKQQCATSGVVLTLTVNNGPCSLGSTSSDPNYGSTSYVEAVLSGPVTTIFANLVGLHSIHIAVRAEAYVAPSFCLFTSTSNTTSSGPQGILLNGGTLSANCGVMDDSGSSGALASNSGATFNSTKFDVHGGWSPNNGGAFSSTPVTAVPAVADPLSYLTPPTAGSCTSQTVAGTGSTTLNPGTFCSGFNLNSNTTVALNPGTYIIEGGVNVGSGATMTGTGVTLYFTGSGQLQMNSGSTAQLVAPTTGSLGGILIWEASTDSNAIILNGNTSADFQGAVYAPAAQLTINSAANTAQYTILDVNTLILNTGANFTINSNYSSLAGGSPVKSGSAVLAE
jgi:Flp pilus assembly protein TadG